MCSYYCPASQEMKAFWLPSKTPEAAALAGQAGSWPRLLPSVSGKKLRLKELVTPVRFTRVGEDEPGFALDPVTRDTLANSDKLVVLRPTGASPLDWPYIVGTAVLSALSGICARSGDQRVL